MGKNYRQFEKGTVMKLIDIIKENLTFNKNSYDMFVDGYKYLVLCRKTVSNSIIKQKQERKRSEKRIKEAIDKREKKKDGSLWSQSDLYNVNFSHNIWNKQYIGYLKRVQQLESDWLQLLSDVGVEMFSGDDVEEIELLVPRADTPVGK